MHDERSAFRALLTFTAAAIAAVLIVAMSPHKAKAASLGVEVEADVGGALTNDQLSSGPSKLDLSQAGLAAGVGASLLWQDEKFILGVMGRYLYMHESGDVFSAAITSHNLIETGAKFGVRLTPASNVYGVAGWAWKDMDLSSVSSSLGTKTINGPFVGGGLEHQIAKSQFYIRAEADHFFFSDQALGEGTKLAPDTTVVLVGLAYKFGGSAAPLAPLK